MAMNPQSTSQLIAQQAIASRQAQQQAEANTPVPQALTQAAQQVGQGPGVNLNASNPIGLLSQGISGSVNALTAGQGRQTAQTNADRANAIRLEQQQYDRGQTAAATEYSQGQDALDNAFRQNQADEQAAQNLIKNQRLNRNEARLVQDRNAQIAGERAQIAHQQNVTQYGAERAQEYVDKGIDLNSPNISIAQDLNRFDAQKAESGDTFNAVEDFISKQPKDISDDVGARRNIQDDVNDGLSQAKKGFGDSWDTAYEQLAIQRALANTEVGAGVFGILEGNFDEEGFKDRLDLEMRNIIDAKGLASDISAIEGNYNKKVSSSQLKAQAAGTR